MSSQRLIGHPNSPKIDDHEVNGLLGVEDSLAYEVQEIEHHIHSYERWFEAAAIPVGESHIADEIGIGTAFQADAGNDNWGSWIQIIGSADTPIIPGNKKYDLHRILFSEHEVNNQIYIIQIGFGDSGAIALTNGTHTTFAIRTGAGISPIPPAELQNKRHDIGTKAWLRLRAPGANTGTLDFFIGGHGYQG